MVTLPAHSTLDAGTRVSAEGNKSRTLADTGTGLGLPLKQESLSFLGMWGLWWIFPVSDISQKEVPATGSELMVTRGLHREKNDANTLGKKGEMQIVCVCALTFSQGFKGWKLKKCSVVWGWSTCSHCRRVQFHMTRYEHSCSCYVTEYCPPGANNAKIVTTLPILISLLGEK